MKINQPCKRMPEIKEVWICDLRAAKRESVCARWARAIKDKIGIDVSFSGDKTSGLLMRWNSNNVSDQMTERAANYTWQVLTM